MVTGDDIRRIRKAQKLTLADLARKTNLSISYLSEVERGISQPTLRTFCLIMHVMDFKVALLPHAPELPLDAAQVGQALEQIRDDIEELIFEVYGAKGKPGVAE